MCHIEVWFTTPGGSYDMACVTSIQPPQNTTSLANTFFPTLAERPEVAVGHLSTSGQRLHVYKRTVRIADVAGITPLEFAANIEDYQALVSANPARSPVLHLASTCFGGGGTSQQCIASVRLTFEGTFWDRATQSPS